MADFIEVADRVWVARYEWADANITAIGGERGVVVLDTHASTAAGRRVVDDLRRLGAGDTYAVVNSHWHWDHAFGNAAFREVRPDVPIHAHERAAAWLAEHGETVKRGWPADDPHASEIAQTQIVVPDRVFARTATIDLGDRAVELIHPGRGHTDGDIVVRVPNADVLLAGDLVEESAHPWIGEDSWPLEWSATLDVVGGMLMERSVVVPGHGTPVDLNFVRAQRNEIADIAEMVRRLAEAGVPASQAAAAGVWPWDADDVRIANAIRRGYEQVG
ncbi:MBL fold metallo-hydrolase [Calidifontibacter indicus]|uniref:MBL fold metallo-hydrolase n=1 Tax=Calidifontibacter indicus TaxID=419650 RepID=UPI003D745BFD